MASEIAIGEVSIAPRTHNHGRRSGARGAKFAGTKGRRLSECQPSPQPFIRDLPNLTWRDFLSRHGLRTPVSRSLALPCAFLLLLMARAKKGTSNPPPGDGATAQAPDPQPQRMGSQRKAAQTRARNREKEEQTTLTIPHLAAAGPRQSKTRAGDKIHEWSAPQRKWTISATEPLAEQDQTKIEKPKKKSCKNSGSAPRAKHSGGSNTSLPHSLLSHDNEQSEESVLANSINQPLPPKTIVTNAAKPRATKKTTRRSPADSEGELQDWGSDEGPDGRRRDSNSSSDDDDDGSFRPESESESDGGHVDRTLEVPKWTKNKDKNRSSALVVDSDNDEDMLIPQVIDNVQGTLSRRASNASNISMRTSSSGHEGPPLTVATTSDDEEGHHSDTSFELVSVQNWQLASRAHCGSRYWTR
ncbi:hypothetical protein NM688_g5448 [Phlebia brevispora]|uniref:Uncharacterized protein n=1 Tax=Phlebia brevispora TaxID=194682 RepID=A0ACC1SV96_9APHY|nr:hypothetical protein NM688_g5448 [Phlebia brevispora]